MRITKRAARVTTSHDNSSTNKFSLKNLHVMNDYSYTYVKHR